jgi:hypothetical protein
MLTRFRLSRRHGVLALLATIALVACGARVARESAAAQSGPLTLFNGRDLADWTVKIAKHDVGENFGNTFRVEDGLLKVRYDQYGDFDSQFGHIFFKTPFSSYHLVVEYRFVGEWQRGTPSWAYRNSGVMLHSQNPTSMPKNQDFPISIELQFLGGLSDGRARTTANMCSPGTDVTINGTTARAHCVNSSSKTFDGDQWVRVEAIVLGDSSITHVVNGDTVMRYTKPRIGGGSVSGFDPAVKRDGTPLTAGFIALQSEGHPIDFRRVELRNLGAPSARR